MFRYNALKKISAPARHARTIQVIKYPDWVLLWVVMGLLAGVLVWASTVELTTRVKGSGIFLPAGGRVVDVAVPFSGTLDRIFPDHGGYVNEGDIIAQFRAPERQRAFAHAMRDLHQAKQVLQQHVTRVANARELRRRNLRKQFGNIQTEIAVAQLASDGARQDHISHQTLFEQNQITQAALATKRLAYVKAHAELNTLQARLAELSQAEAEKKAQEDAHTTELQQAVKRAQDRYAEAGLRVDALRVAALVAGEVVEIKAAEGALLTAGTPFLSIMTRVAKRNFTSIILAEGSLQNQSAGDKPDLNLLNLFATQPRSELEFIAYINVHDGKRIQPGTHLQIEVDYLDRNEYGMVEGVAVEVSELPISVAGIASKLGNSALVAQFTRAGALYEVRVELSYDPSSKNKLRWTPGIGSEESSIAIGSFGRVEFILAKRKPITLLLPLLRSWFA